MHSWSRTINLSGDTPATKALTGRGGEDGMVLARFLPRDEQFYVHFRDAAENAAETARLLAEVVDNGSETERKVRRLRDLEHHGDEISHRIFSALNSTFVTPLDREDIRDLTTALDNFVDDLEETGKRLWLYRLGAPTELAHLFSRLLKEQGEAIARAVPLLEHTGDNAQELRRWVLELHRLENEGDDALSKALAALYDGADDIPKLICALRWGELYQLLEQASDRGEDVADTLEGILIKYA
jgi:predicted phosphate transport protein (TIGR00153 family)